MTLILRSRRETTVGYLYYACIRAHGTHFAACVSRQPYAERSSSSGNDFQDAQEGCMAPSLSRVCRQIRQLRRCLCKRLARTHLGRFSRTPPQELYASLCVRLHWQPHFRPQPRKEPFRGQFSGLPLPPFPHYSTFAFVGVCIDCHIFGPRRTRSPHRPFFGLSAPGGGGM